MEKIRIVIVGDILIDKYFYVETDRISQEAPVPILKVNRTKEVLGGAGKTINAIADLHETLKNFFTNEVSISIAGLFPPYMECPKNIINKCKFPSLSYQGSQTPGFHSYKNRIINEYPYQQLTRFDQDVSLKHGEFPELRQSILESLEQAYVDDGTNISIISDYDKGLIETDILEVVKRKSDIVFVDPRQKSAYFYSDYADIIFPNKKEYDSMFTDEKDFSWFFHNSKGKKAILKKLGSKGCELIFQFDKTTGECSYVSIPAVKTKSEVLSVIGAGDVFISTFALAMTELLNNKKTFTENYLKAAKFANAVTSIAIVNTECNPVLIENEKYKIASYFKQIIKNA